ncbi:hypothetical protein DMB38_33735 [Streptomyces sp. WAC 06738]|uniref:hypothetical protein n=1 Tax=Streptomyces sp. WAC 06738 TaxID=2203210 RepID=UPI000F6BA36C|nr:hypothetical protein [Streptomyces sp. WAC 06738]AZM50094.1 hypothetical protein DMB38_33735 [Streptomyces sp. WAC 06738]
MAGDRGISAAKSGTWKSGTPGGRAAKASSRKSRTQKGGAGKSGAQRNGDADATPQTGTPGSRVPRSRTPQSTAPPEPPEPPPRVTVAHPRTLAARSSQPLPGSRALVADDLGRQTPLGDVYLRSLMRTQLRLAAFVVGALGVVLGALPVLLATVPSVRDSTLAGVPVPWLVIGVAVHPVILALAWVYQRQARKNEAEFADLVERS